MNRLRRIPAPLCAFFALLALYFFLIGIGSFGAAFKMMGKDYSQELLSSQSGPLVSLFIGILATTLVQSSSTTTSVVVALVAANALPLEQAVFMVMGANIGTTVTNTLVSLGHMRQSAEYERAFAAATVHDFFNIMVLSLLFPLELMTGILTKMADGCVSLFDGVGGQKLTSPVKLVTKPVIGELKTWFAPMGDMGGWAMAVFALALTYICLFIMVKMLRALARTKLEALFDRVLFRSAPMALLFGLALTILVQSSSVTTSMAVPLVGAGIITVRQVFPYTMGANIGTTGTALLAALAAMAAATDGDPKAIHGLTLAFHHVLFNVLGVAVVWPFRGLPVLVAERFARLAMSRPWIPIVYIVSTFFLLPFVIIYFGR